ncbi:hypothetical protein F1559_001081 [Cyanidiococcus yangmingshanensis]|uniref:Uncharacterized protein n=1 Tax=Cyanidiococcus yangmingshanensis TaxID=2690220 RepID=A0A7J7INE2_9RHOD|nr:hypothetical protein F1559_001081 [Cyanidiococcus yangmingshanensis]
MRSSQRCYRLKYLLQVLNGTWARTRRHAPPDKATGILCNLPGYRSLDSVQRNLIHVNVTEMDLRDTRIQLSAYRVASSAPGKSARQRKKSETDRGNLRNENQNSIGNIYTSSERSCHDLGPDSIRMHCPSSPWPTRLLPLRQPVYASDIADSHKRSRRRSHDVATAPSKGHASIFINPSRPEQYVSIDTELCFRRCLN